MREIRAWKFAMSLEKSESSQKARWVNSISDSSRGVSRSLKNALSLQRADSLQLLGKGSDMDLVSFLK